LKTNIVIAAENLQKMTSRTNIVLCHGVFKSAVNQSIPGNLLNQDMAYKMGVRV
jgi:hypothetical protein